jgi:1-aminocyclopropane-1-carboxylate deaminase/D-cysteine desulfhydrase-like pyridoxal-dependent ACC family enzyme
VYDLMQQAIIQPGEKVLFIHTGGLIGNLGMKDKLQ